MPRLHHLALGARDVLEVAGFYQEVFALRRMATHHHQDGSLRSIWLSLDPGLLMIEKTEALARQVEGIGAGPFLVAFTVTESERSVYESRLRVRGVEIESRSAATSYFRDPEGNRVAISHYVI